MRYLPLTEGDRRAMLATIGVPSVDALFRDVPKPAWLDKPVDLPPQLKQPDNRAMLTSTLFGAVVGNLLYYPRNYPSLPRLIAAVHDGDTSGLGLIMEAVVMEAAASDIADQTAVECRDRPHLRMPLAKDASSLSDLG